MRQVPLFRVPHPSQPLSTRDPPPRLTLCSGYEYVYCIAWQPPDAGMGIWPQHAWATHTESPTPQGWVFKRLIKVTLASAPRSAYRELFIEQLSIDCLLVVVLRGGERENERLAGSAASVDAERQRPEWLR